MAWIPGFERALEPQSIAIVGVSRSERQEHFGTSGLAIMRALREAGYKGAVYPINPKADEIDGTKAFAALSALPEQADLVIVAVPAAVVPQVLEDCIKAGMLNVQVCSSGFAETGEQKGRILEEKVRQIVRRGGLRLLGPNCLGIQVPRLGITTISHAKLVTGPVGFLSQSGGHTNRFLKYGPKVGVGFSKIISYGNAAGLDVVDLLEYMCSDKDTKVICLYLEGAPRGNMLVSMVRKINRIKPVIVWKGGLTDFGARAAASHTGSLAGNSQMWDAFFKQTGAVRVSSIEEMAEVCAAFINLPPPSGNRAVVISGGGGNNVAAGDICAEEGIQLLPLSYKLKHGLSQFISFVNQGLTNPLEAASMFFSSSQMRKAMALFNNEPSIDIVIVSLLMAHMDEKGTIDKILDTLADISKEKELRKLLVVTLTDSVTEDAFQYWQKIRKAGILWYPTLRQTCIAVSKYVAYHEFLKKI